MSAPYAPFMDPRAARPPGTSPLDPADWLRVDPDYAAQMARRDNLFATEPPEALWAALPGAEAPLAELRDAALGWMARDGRWRVAAQTVTRPDGARVARDAPALPLLGRLAQEDMLLLAPGAPEYRLIGGVLCFPSRWSLSEKLGLPLTAVHAPVPDYAAHLARRVNRLFEGLRPDAPLMRVNWLVHPTDTLRQPMREAEKASPPDLSRGWFLRTERQCLLRLPVSRAVVFTIKTTLTPVAELDAPQRVALRAALGEWRPDEIAYRGGEGVWRGALAALS